MQDINMKRFYERESGKQKLKYHKHDQLTFVLNSLKGISQFVDIEISDR